VGKAGKAGKAPPQVSSGLIRQGFIQPGGQHVKEVPHGGVDLMVVSGSLAKKYLSLEIDGFRRAAESAPG
jgi:hypothetical protein